ncbi:MAG: AAA family ATPase [Pirellulales bacterium]|nr:AAA family ATPase [Pirellulales bacterium]
MRSIAIINQKGGVGKTTTAVHLAAALAEMGQRVALVDLDPQAHATLHLGQSPIEADASTYDVLASDATLDAVLQPVRENLDLAASHIDLAAAEVELAGVVGRELILRDQLAALPDKYDVLLIDCPPSLGILTINALAAVDEVFLPLQPHFLALHGLSKLLQTIELVSHRLNDRLRLTGVVLCLYDTGTRLAAEVSSDVEQFFAGAVEHNRAWSDVRIFAARIRRNIRLAEAPSFGQTVFEYAPSSNGAEDYRALASEVVEARAPLARAA